MMSSRHVARTFRRTGSVNALVNCDPNVPSSSWLTPAERLWRLNASLRLLAVVAAVVGLPSDLWSAEKVKKQETSFETDVVPILKARCFSCHSGSKPKANLDLTNRQSVLRGGQSGAAVRTRAAESSLLWERIASGEMPAEGPPLTTNQKGIIRTWINEGTLGEDNSATDDATASNPVISDEDRSHWSFQTPRRPA